MERREFFTSSAFMVVNLAGLDKVVKGINPIEEKDPISEIKTEIEELMRRTNTTLQYHFNENGIHNFTTIFPGEILYDGIPLPKLKKIKSQLEIYAHPFHNIPGHGRTMFV